MPVHKILEVLRSFPWPKNQKRAPMDLVPPTCLDLVFNFLLAPYCLITTYEVECQFHICLLNMSESKDYQFISHVHRTFARDNGAGITNGLG